MQTFLQNLLNGVAVGAIYALIALGYTMVYGILKLINFAHGDVFMLGSFAGFYAGGWAARHLHTEGGALGWTTGFGLVAPDPVLTAYVERIRARPASDPNSRCRIPEARCRKVICLGVWAIHSQSPSGIWNPASGIEPN